MENRSKFREEIEELIMVIAKPSDETEIKNIAKEYFNNIDSLRLIELLTAIENKYKIAISTKDMIKIKTNDLDAFINIIAKYVIEK